MKGPQEESLSSSYLDQCYWPSFTGSGHLRSLLLHNFIQIVWGFHPLKTPYATGLKPCLFGWRYFGVMSLNSFHTTWGSIRALSDDCFRDSCKVDQTLNPYLIPLLASAPGASLRSWLNRRWRTRITFIRNIATCINPGSWPESNSPFSSPWGNRSGWNCIFS